VGDLAKATAKIVVDANNLAVAPGFINMLSWSTDSLLVDGRGQSEIRQGVTTQIMGEGNSWGPVNPAIKKRMKAEQTDIKYDIEWTTLSDYLYFLQRKGISQNVASFLGATTVREYVLGLDNKKPTPDQLEQMRQLVHHAMRDGPWALPAPWSTLRPTMPTRKNSSRCARRRRRTRESTSPICAAREYGCWRASTK